MSVLPGSALRTLVDIATCVLKAEPGTLIVQEPVIGLIKWLRPKGSKVCSYVEKCAEFKNQTLKKSTGTQTEYLGIAISLNNAKMGVPLQVYNLNHVILVVKCKFWQQTIYNDQCLI